MSLKSLVAIASGAQEDADVLATAARLGTRFGGRVRVIPAFPDPSAALVYYGAALRSAPGAAERVAEAEREGQQRVEALGREIATREGLAFGADAPAPALSVEQRSLLPVVALAPAAVLADLVVFGATAASAGLSGLFAETLLGTRAPMLLVKAPGYVGGRIAVAWDGSAQAGRAVRAATPLLQAAESVLILRNVDDRTPEAEAGGAERLKAYLGGHGVARIETGDLHGQRVAESLLAAARVANCEILVAGAYGRPRLFEMVLGGTTRALSHAAGAPNIMLVH